MKNLESRGIEKRRTIELCVLAASLAIALVAVAMPQVASAAEPTRVPVTLPPGATGGGLEAVSCPAAGDCVAVGGYSREGHSTDEDDPMIVSETGGVWGPAAAVAPVGNPTTALFDGVSCDAPGSCVAVGSEGSAGAGPKHPIAATETNGAWGPTFSIPPPAGETVSVLYSVSCAAAGSCVAVGGDEAGPVGVIETGGTWGEAVQITPPPGATGKPVGTTNIFSYVGVSCAAVGSCVGVGEAFDGENHREASAADESGSAWGQSTLIPPPFAPGPAGYALEGVSCTAVGSCAAVGENGSAGPFAVTQSGGTWGQSTSVPLPAGSSAGTLFGISCPETGSCLAVGDSSSAEGDSAPMIAVEAGGSWTPTGVGAPAGSAFATLLGASCPAGGACASVGTALLGSGTDEPLVYAGGGPGTPSTSGNGPFTAPSSGGAVPTAPSCAISVAGRSIPVSRGRVARLGLIDTGGAACHGIVSLSVRIRGKGKKTKLKSKSKKVRTIGNAPLKLEPGKKAVVMLRMNGAGKAALRKAHGRLKAELAVRADGAQILEPVRLRAEKKKRGGKS